MQKSLISIKFALKSIDRSNYCAEDDDYYRKRDRNYREDGYYNNGGHSHSRR